MANSSASVTWSEVAKAITDYLISQKYPENLSKNEKRNLRKRAQDFAVFEGKLHYKSKNGRNRIVITSKEEKDRVFQVFYY